MISDTTRIAIVLLPVKPTLKNTAKIIHRSRKQIKTVHDKNTSSSCTRSKTNLNIDFKKVCFFCETTNHKGAEIYCK